MPLPDYSLSVRRRPLLAVCSSLIDVYRCFSRQPFAASPLLRSAMITAPTRVDGALPSPMGGSSVSTLGMREEGASHFAGLVVGIMVRAFDTLRCRSISLPFADTCLIF